MNRRDVMRMTGVGMLAAGLPGFGMAEGASPGSGKPLTYDGRSFLPLLRGEPFNPREWIFVGVSFGSPMWYVREDKWKLDQSGKLFDMKDTPFSEPEVSAKSKNPEAVAARTRLQAVLDKLNPAGGKMAPRKPDILEGPGR